MIGHNLPHSLHVSNKMIQYVNKLTHFRHGWHFPLSRNFSSVAPKITTHYTVVPRETDPRWKEIDMERAADETDVSIDDQ